MPDCSASTGCWKKRGADRQGCSRLTDLGERHRFCGRMKKDAGQWQWPVRRLFFSFMDLACEAHPWISET